VIGVNQVRESEGNVPQNADLRFRRQFVLTPNPVDDLTHWRHITIHNECSHLYVHPDLEATFVQNDTNTIKLALLGFALDPTRPQHHNRDIAKALAHEAATLDDLLMSAGNLAGRFVCIVELHDQLYVLHDACGLRSVFYTYRPDGLYIASRPALLSTVCDLEPADYAESFLDSRYKAENADFWLPSRVTLYKDVHHLTPNHYLDVANAKQVRFWPQQPIVERRIEDVVPCAAQMLQSLMTSANARYNLALPLTAGWDSRMLLAASRDILEDVYLYTLLFRHLTAQSPDVRIPRQLADEHHFMHDVRDCRGAMDDGFSHIYYENVDLAHEGWGDIASKMLDQFPSEYISVSGNGSEIARCSYYKSGAHEPITSACQLAELHLQKGWGEIPFIVDTLDTWLRDVQTTGVDTKIDVLDLFYWEHRMGSWAAQAQTEWDIVHETFLPFNYRPLLEVMLGAPTAYRRQYDYLLYRQIIECLWPGLMDTPINPTDRKKKLKSNLRSLLQRIGMYQQVRRGYRQLMRGR
jgi:hypothetical protein